MNKKIKLFRITGAYDDLDSTLEQFIKIKCIYAIKSSEFKELTHGLFPVSTDNPWEHILQEIKDLENEVNIKIPVTDKHTIDYSLKSIREYVRTTHENLHKLVEYQKETEQLIRQYEDALMQVNNIIDLDISLDDIFSCEYINAKFGKLPVESLDILKLYDKKPIIFELFKKEKNYYWCMYLTTNKYEKEIDNIFSSLYFDHVYIPDYIHGTPENAQETLKKEIEVTTKNLNEIKTKVEKEFKENLDKLSETKSELIFLTRLYDARKYAISLGDKFNITGFIQESYVDKLTKLMEHEQGIEVSIMPGDIDKRLKPPKKWRNILKQPCFKEEN